jgi:hypothetical protein
MPMPDYFDYAKEACPILFIDGFEGVDLLQYVTIRMPHPCPSSFPKTQIRLLCLEEGATGYESNHWKDITDQIYYLERKNSIELQVLHFSW